MTAEKKISKAKLLVSEGNLGKAAMRLLSQRLVSTEILYVQRLLGPKATQQEIDTQVIAVRGMPWAEIVNPND